MGSTSVPRAVSMPWAATCLTPGTSRLVLSAGAKHRGKLYCVEVVDTGSRLGSVLPLTGEALGDFVVARLVETYCVCLQRSVPHGSVVTLTR